MTHPHPSPALVDDLGVVIQSHDAHDADQRWEAAAWQALATVPTNLAREGRPAHFTASALPIDPATERVCLVLHAKINQWVQPGGHMEPGDASVTQAAMRELREETGLGGRPDPVPLALSRHRAPCGADWHLDVQLFVATAEVAPQVSDESHDVAWFDAHDLPSAMADGVADLVAAAVARVRAGAA